MTDFQALLSMSDVDSAALRGVSAVAHRFDHGGAFAVQVLRGRADAQVPAHASPHVAILDVGPTKAVGGAGPTLDRTSVPLDLARLSGLGGAAQTVQITPGQYVLFHAMAGDEPHAVVVRAPDGQAAGGPGFDSRQLGPGDVFSTVIVRPGRYALANSLTGTSGRLTVAYPVVTPGTPYRPPDPLTVECGPTGFTPADVSVLPGQGLIFTIGAPARIIISLTTPDDGPGGPDRGGHGGDATRLPVDRER